MIFIFTVCVAKKTTKSLFQDRRCSSKNSNRVHPEYNTQAQSTASHCQLTSPTGERLHRCAEGSLLHSRASHCQLTSPTGERLFTDLQKGLFFSQERLTVNWLAPRERNTSRMRRRVSSDWLPSYIKATRPVFEIFKMAGYSRQAS